MRKKNLPHRKDTAGRPPEANESVLSPDPAASDTLAERETAVLNQEQALLGREKAATLREEDAGLREEDAGQREEAAGLREKVTEQDAKAKDAHSARTEAQLRDANEHLIVATVRAHTMTDAAEQTAALMTHKAGHDFLTGLPNRMLLTDRLAQAIARAQRHDKKVALMYLDLDHFKQINDSLGHEAGDQLLQSAARRLKTCVRLSDTVSRQGGDEFVVLLPEVDEVQGAVLTAEKLIAAMTKPHLIGGHRLQVTLSIGVSLYPDDGKDVETVFRNADTAMYHAKKTGRNNYQVFTPDMNAGALEKRAIEQELHQALDQGRFVLHYQPKVNLATGAITGAEALLRWQRSDHRLVGPTEFMSIAEDCGLILPIGKWVLREACRQTRAWLTAGLKLDQIAVNVSAKEFLDKNFLADVRTILSDTGLEPHYLEIELTESGLMHDTEQTAAILSALKDIGVKIAVDDFGSGYSSLRNLWSYPIDTLKIDQSFVQDIDGDAGKAIVRTIIAMGMSLNQRVVAEGIETRQQLAFLQFHRCAEGQGYHFGRPVAARNFATLLIVYDKENSIL